MTADRWRDIELRHLAALQAIAEEGSFHAAAERLGYSQSAVSQQIAALERIVGVTLIARPGGPRKIYLTDAGRLLLQHAEAIIARLQAAQADTAGAATGRRAVLRVGTYQSVSEKILPSLIARLDAAHPGTDVSLIESESDDEPLRHLERGDLDLTFALQPLREGPFASTELMRDPWVLLVRSDSPLALRGGPVSMEDLADLPLIGARLPRCRMQIDAQFQACGLDPRFVLRTDENGTVSRLVAAGLGVGIAPRLAVDDRDPALVTLPLSPSPPARVIILAWHQYRRLSDPASTFIQLATELCAQLERDPEPV